MKTPDLREELTVANNAHDRTVRREQEVVEAHGRLGGFRMPVRILRLYGRRVEKRGSRDGIHAEAEYVERGEVYSKAQRRFARVVRYWLWVEATRLQIK